MTTGQLATTIDHATAPARRAALFHPLVDFLALGGASIVILPCLMLLPESLVPTLAVVSLALSMVVNNPHFAHSYQLFYRDFRAKAFGGDYEGLYRLRYLNAALAVPLAMLAFFAVGLAAGRADLVGLGANLMFFLVGWHYVKQGYGILMVDSALQKNFFDEDEKRALRVNGYAAWILSYMIVNLTMVETSFFDLQYYAIAFPEVVVYAAGLVLLLTSARAALVLAAKAGGEASFPVNGSVAYVVSLYPWLWVAVEPTTILLIPAFHSLQYLVVVWRYELNVAHEVDSHAPQKPFIRFLIIGASLGFLGFWGLPLVLDSAVVYDRELFGNTLFLFLFWVFINVHHYSIDNVLWRGENPDTRRYLFAHRKRQG